VHGDGRQERDFLHVADLVDGLLRLGTVAADGIWNVSAGASTTVHELAAVVEGIVGRPLGRTMAPRRAGDVRLSRIANGALRELGWSPRVPLQQGLREVVLEGP
jgi:nucleoside-diphosphate-sugar epimerase